MMLDFKKPFLYADIHRELYIELPEDDDRRAGGANVGLLNKAMYGTRDAPVAWSRLVRQMLGDLGFGIFSKLQFVCSCIRLRRQRLCPMLMTFYARDLG